MHDDSSCSELPRPPRAVKGRGATSNISGRFDVQTVEAVDDGWGELGDERQSGELRRCSEVTGERAKTILTRNASPDIPFNVSINPYRGCEHGCIYCFARPSHSYLGLSPGLDFESRIIAKLNAPELLRAELASASYTPEPVALGVNTDAYQPCERRLGITRKLLEVLYECEHPVGLITKASLIERDIDLLREMAAKQQAVVTITITTLDHAVARSLEPRATSPNRRLQTISRLAAAGVPVGVNIAPIIPFVTDHELERVVQAAADAGVSNASYIILRLPWEVAPLFQQWLQAHFPGRAERVMNRVRDMAGGADYNSEFGARMKGQGVFADLLRQRFYGAVKRAGLSTGNTRFGTLDCSSFRRPLRVPASGSDCDETQLDLFG